MVFVTFTVGAGIPVLFPIGFISLFLFYVTERLMIAYSYRKPPMYGSETNQAALKLMSIAPILYCCSGAWFYSNQAVFRNRTHVNTTDYLFGDSIHNFAQFFSQITPGSVYVVTLIVMILYSLFLSFRKLVWKQSSDDELFEEQD